jgi:hypothetical protein
MGLIVMHRPCVQNHNRILWDEPPLIREVLARNMRGSEPKRIMAAFDLQIS